MHSPEEHSCEKELNLPFPIERLRGQVIHCPTCGGPLALLRRRRFYALCATLQEEPDGGVLLCRHCGRAQLIRDLLSHKRRPKSR